MGTSGAKNSIGGASQLMSHTQAAAESGHHVKMPRGAVTRVSVPIRAEVVARRADPGAQLVDAKT